MVRDTLRQSVATKLFWVMLATTVVATVVCLSVSVTGDAAPTRLDYEVPAVLPKGEVDRLGSEKVRADGVRVVSGEMTIGFGAMRVPVGRNREDSVRLIQLWLVAAVADTVGVLLALLWTAGFLPTFLEPQSATVLLAKPASRWAVLLGKYVGVVLFVGLNAALFVGSTWLALGVRTGVYAEDYWLAVPLLIFNFGVFYAVSAFLAVWTRSAVASAFGTLLFWLACWAMNYTHLRLAAYPVDGLGPVAQALLDIGYWTLPKPLDLAGIFHDTMRADGFVAGVDELRLAREAGRFSPELSVLASGGFAVVTLALTAHEFEMTDY
jgi:ABC-type transport system involved in multi-copper enzyme maturation permease subunit